MIGKMIVTTPSGWSPFVLESLREDDILYWVRLHEDYNYMSGLLSLSAVKYWVRGFHNYHTPEHKWIMEVIDKNKDTFSFPKTKTHEEIMASIQRSKEKEAADKQRILEKRERRRNATKKNN